MNYRIHCLLILLLSFTTASQALSIEGAIEKYCPECSNKAKQSTASLILDRGKTSLLSRAWLTANAQHSIDIQYFIWSNDNIGILAAESLLDAAQRGVKVRVIVDDFLVDADRTWLMSLEAHPNISIKVYNPLHKVGVSKVQRWYNLGSRFRDANQRMHDKVAIFDGAIAITGGRNMADEYFDFNQKYSFRDRDILVYGQAINTMKTSFNNFWQHSLSKSVKTLLQKPFDKLTQDQIANAQAALSAYAENPEHFSQEVKDSITHLEQGFENIVGELRWSEATFIHDLPGKNDGQSGLKGGGQSTQAIIKLLNNTEHELIIQSPYTVIPKEALALFKQLIDRGVSIKISTNSLASTDNLAAYSGYHNMRNRLLETGIELYEYKPHPANQAKLNQRYLKTKASPPIFAIHAKSMVIDGKTAVIGTFNLDPRSIHLNTEVAMVVNDDTTAKNLRTLILDDMKLENSWKISKQKNPDNEVSLWKRTKMNLIKVLPLESIL